MGKIQPCRYCRKEWDFKGGSPFCSPKCLDDHEHERSLIYYRLVRKTRGTPQAKQGRERYEQWLESTKSNR
jgi:hypothetical protein